MSSGTELPGATPPAELLGRGTGVLETFLSLMPEAAVAVDGDGIIVAVNERTEAFFGYSSAEVEGKPIEMLVPERFRHTHRGQRSEYSIDPHARPMGAGLDLYARRQDGSEFPVDISLAPIGGGQDPLVVAAIRDITERKASQSAQAQLAAIVQSSTDGIFSMTGNGAITSWNPAAESMLGYDRSAVIGHHIGQFFPDDRVLEELLDAARSGRTSPPRDTQWLTHDGRPIEVAISVSQLSGGEDVGYSVLVRDIGVRKAAEARLRLQAGWQTATAAIRLSLLSEGPLDDQLEIICTWAVDLSGAHGSAVVVVADPRARAAASAGDPQAVEAVEGDLAAAAALGPGEGLALAGGLEARAYPISFPRGDAPWTGALVVATAPGLRAEPGLDEVLASLAHQAVLAFELASVRSERDHLLLSADRERIARDLHDLVIQRLFGAGLRLQGALSLISNEVAAARVSSTIDDLDTTIKEIREAIFALESSPGTGLQARVLEAVAHVTEQLGFTPAIAFHGPIEREIPLQVQLEAGAVLREALSNAARHAQATRVEVHVTVDDELAVLVVDNGVGAGHPEHLSGIANARARAELLGGHLQLSPAEGGGTRLEWRVPLLAPPD